MESDGKAVTPTTGDSLSVSVSSRSSHLDMLGVRKRPGSGVPPQQLPSPSHDMIAGMASAAQAGVLQQFTNSMDAGVDYHDLKLVESGLITRASMLTKCSSSTSNSSATGHDMTNNMENDDEVKPSTSSQAISREENANDELALSMISSASSKHNQQKPKKRVILVTDAKDADLAAVAAETEGLLSVPVDLFYMPKQCAEQVELFAKYVWETGWKAMPHHALPAWMRDNDFLLKGHRPPLPSVRRCLNSIFRIHTETGNIWTHLVGAISFIAVAVYFFTRPSLEVQLQEKLIFGAFFSGAIVCLLCSTLFHTFCCFSQKVSKTFNKIDYCGISVLTMGSFVPWLYYAFYCEVWPKVIYMILMFVLGNACIVVSLWDKFSEPQFRAIRAGMFIALGLSGIIPAVHYILLYGSHKAFNVGGLGWLILMAVLYIVGATLYAVRVPERLFPGSFDIWFQSHQIFHVCVVVAAYVHYHGITKLAMYRLTIGDCLTVHLESDFSFEF